MPFVMKASRDEPRPEIPLTGPEQQIANVVRTATGDAQTAAMSNAVREAIAARNIEQVVEAFPWDSTAQVLNQTAETFGQVITENIGNGFPTVAFRGRFDYTDPRTLEWAKNQSATLVTAVTDSMRNDIRFVVSQGLTENLTVKQISKELSQIIGLNERQANSYRKFVNNLDEQVRAGKLSIAQMKKMTERQYKKMIKYRSQMIARQEILMAENHGRYLGFTQAVEQGWAHPKSMKRWSTSTDERTCEICMPMNGKSVQWDQSYPNGVFNPPAHIMCRCSISLLEPDSSLAQSFMPPAKIAPATTDTPIPLLPTLPIGNLNSIADAVESAHTRASGISHAQYDAGDIENLDLTIESVNFNGTPHTEVRFKLTEDAKNRLIEDIQRNGAQTWQTEKGLVMVDKKVGRNISFSPADIPHPEGSSMFYRVGDAINGQDPHFAYLKEMNINADPRLRNSTYTSFRPNGTAIRFTESNAAYAFDGQVRIMIPGKATSTQIDEVMRSLKVTATRTPSEVDIKNYKTNRIISLFKPEVKSSTLAMKEKYVEAITKQWGFTLDEVATVLDTRGKMTLELPEKVVKKIVKDTGVRGIQHNLGSFAAGDDAETAIKKVVNLFTNSPRLTATTGRINQGVVGRGVSMGTDINTGGADFIFTRPIRDAENLLSDVGTNRRSWVLEWDSKSLLSRTDWFASADDSYGVVNPMLNSYWNGKTPFSNPNWFEELRQAKNNAEVMFRDGVDITNIRRMSVPENIRGDIISALKGLGIDEWNGMPIEKVLVNGSRYL